MLLNTLVFDSDQAEALATVFADWLAAVAELPSAELRSRRVTDLAMGKM